MAAKLQEQQQVFNEKYDSVVGMKLWVHSEGLVGDVFLILFYVFLKKSVPRECVRVCDCVWRRAALRRSQILCLSNGPPHTRLSAGWLTCRARRSDFWCRWDDQNARCRWDDQNACNDELVVARLQGSMVWLTEGAVW